MMSVLGALLRLLAWRRLKEEPFRLLLTLVGVAWASPCSLPSSSRTVRHPGV